METSAEEFIAWPNWRELTVYLKEVHPVFHTLEDYHAALRFLISPYPKVQEILADWSKNWPIALRNFLVRNFSLP